jgi:hypothetical protein
LFKLQVLLRRIKGKLKGGSIAGIGGSSGEEVILHSRGGFKIFLSVGTTRGALKLKYIFTCGTFILETSRRMSF